MLVLCLLFSVLLHLLVVFATYENPRTKDQPAKTEKPTIVRLVDRPEPTGKREYEIDQSPTLPEEKPQQETTRLAEKSQRVEKQQAPKGVDERDQPARQASKQAPAPAPASQAPPAESQQPRQQTAPQQAVEPETQRPLAEQGRLKRPEATQPHATTEQQQAPIYPSLQQLTQLSQSTLDRSINSGRAEREKAKQRDDIDEGDTVWLNLERGMLISFFRRFRNQIEGVWNYPAEAVQKGIEGLLLVKITINRNGELLDVELLRGSGSDILDFEAIQAIYRAAPFGPLPSHYQHPELKIHAHFRYQITGKYIYGRP
ncbi:MAG TPA: TonB family protein [Malonomonas sp.]